MPVDNDSRFTQLIKDAGLVSQKTANELRVTGKRSGELTKPVRDCIGGGCGVEAKGYLNFLGKDVVGVWNWQKKYNWGIVSEIGKDEAYSVVTGMRSNFSKGFFFCLIGFLFISIYFGRKLCAPVLRLNNAVNNVVSKRGQKKIIGIKGRDEIEDLTNSFNEMVFSLKEKDLITNFNEIVASSLLPDVFEAIGNELKRMIHFDRISISYVHKSSSGKKHLDTFVASDCRGEDCKVSKLEVGTIFDLKGSLTGEVLRSGKPIIVEDTQKGIFWSDTVLFNEGLRSRMGYPLVYKNEIVGSLNCSSGQISAFSAKQFYLLEKIAPVLAVSLKNTMFFQAEKEREFVNKINTIIASSLLPDVFDAISKELKVLIDFDRISIAYGYEKDNKKECKLFAMTGDLIPIESSKLKKGTISDLDGSIFGEVLKDEKPVIVPDTENGHLWSDKDLLKEGIRSRFSYPLRYKGSIIATINFGSKKCDNFSEKDINVISELGPQLAVAVENYLLFEKTK